VATIMSPRPDDELDYLLSRGRLGGSQRERILNAALVSSREGFSARWRRRMAWSAGCLTFATGCAALLLFLRAPHEGSAGFRAKGRGAEPLIVVACLGGQMTACSPGSKIAFALEGGDDKGGFLTAYADPIKPGERIWYLTNEVVGAPQSDSLPRVIGKAAVIGNGQPAGSYRVHAILSRRPIARATLSSLPAADKLASTELQLAVRP
jgi:hypothetical protein